MPLRGSDVTRSEYSPRWSVRHGLRLRLFLVTLAVAALGIGTASVIAGRSTTTEFEEYVVEAVAAPQLVYAALETLPPAVFVEADPVLQGGVAALSGEVGQQIVVFDVDRNVIADSNGELVGQSLEGFEPAVGSSLGLLPVDAGFVVGPVGDLAAVGSGEESFLARTRRALLVGALVAVALAAVLSFVFGRRLVRPVEELTEAARRLEDGDLAQRVSASGRSELGQLAHAFNAMAEGLERNERLRQTMVGDVAHELRTPIGNLQGYLEAVRDGVLEPSPDLISSLHDEAVHLGELVSDLQDLSLLDAGQITLDVTAVDAAESVGHAVRAAAGRAEQAGVSLRSEVCADLTPIAADARRLGQVLRNLVANAITHTPHGGSVVVSAEPGQPGPTETATVRLTVRDSGRGIDPAHLPHVTERFYRVDPSRHRSTGGAGLGLAIVERLVGASGATLTIDSMVGEGTAVIIHWPAAAGPAHGAPDHGAVRPGQERRSGTRGASVR